MKKALFYVIFIGLISLGACSSGEKKKNSDCKSCSDFKTQSEAKAYAKKNKQCKKQLDGDGDGKYCENLPK